jgi:glutamate dehydrogenase
VIRIRPARAADGRELGAELVEIVQPDAPFLVDSVMAELVDAGADVMAMFHPIIETPTGRRSAIQVWIEPVGEDRAPRLAQGLAATLADVRVAVADFEPMIALMARTMAELRASPPPGDLAALDEDLAFLAWIRAPRTAATRPRSRKRRRAPASACCATWSAWCCAAAASRPCCRRRRGATSPRRRR